MTQITDQKLEEFISGGLPEVEAREIEAMLNNDPALCARVAALSSAQTADLAETIKAAVENTVKDDVPAEILDMLQSPETVVPISARKKARPLLHIFFQPTAIAASLAVAVAAGLLLFQPSSSDGSLSGHTLTALNSMVDGSQNGATTIGESFLNTDGQFCRSFKVEDPENQVGLACKSDKNWQLIAIVTIPSGAAYVPAGAGSDGLLDDYTSDMRALKDGEETSYLN